MGKKGKAQSTFVSASSASRVARKVKVSRSYLSRILAGKQVPSLPVAQRIAAALKVPLEEVARMSSGEGIVCKLHTVRNLLARGVVSRG